MPMIKGSAAMMLLLALQAQHSHPTKPQATDQTQPTAATAPGRLQVCDAPVAIGLSPLDRRAASERCPQPFTVVPEDP